MKMNKRQYFKELFSNVCFGFKTSYVASKFYFCVKLLIQLFDISFSIINIWLWREVLNSIVAKKIEIVIICLTLYLFLKLVSYLVNLFDHYVNSRFDDELQFYIESVMMEKTSRMDLAFFDSAEMGDKIAQARNNFYIMTDTTELVFGILSASINVVATLVIVTAYRWWLGIITLLLMVPYIVYNKTHNDKLIKMEKEQMRDNRKKDWFYEAFFDTSIQFEIKLNHIGDYFLERYKGIWDKLYKINMKEDVAHNLKLLGIDLLNILSETIAIIVSAFDVTKKIIGIGDLQYNMNMVALLRNQMQTLFSNVNRFISNNSRLIELKEFIEIEPIIEKSGTRLPTANPQIEFRNVSFRYPNSEEYVLKNCSFTIEPHEKVGLIGLNGAGKSTIIKLLFRFYDPEEGVILIDGIDMKEYNVYALRKVFGVLFQDFVTYCLPLREIIALSDFESRFDNEKLQRASELSGVDGIIKDWKQGFDSILGRYYADNGKDLSGGQWQIVGLARAYFKESEYMVLDEPSAALDPISEDRIFDQLYNLSKGKSAVTISHRLSNTTLADKILVLEDGHIIEQGSHRELLEKNGRYAYLFNLQASKYV